MLSVPLPHAFTLGCSTPLPYLGRPASLNGGPMNSRACSEFPHPSSLRSASTARLISPPFLIIVTTYGPPTSYACMGAMLRILLHFLRRSSWPTTPLRREPMGSPALLRRTQALSSKRTTVPSGRWTG